MRLLFLPSLPIVNDEAMYLHWGNDFLQFWREPAMPLSLQGKQALTAITLGVAQLFPIDPLVAGRLTSVLLSLLGLWAFISIARRALPKQSAVPAVWLLASSPLLLFYHRLALPDTAVATSYLWALYAFLLLREKPTLVKSFVLGIAVAIGWWFKSTALMALPALLLSTLFYLSKRIILFSCISIITALFFSIVSLQLPAMNRVVPLSQTGHVFTINELFTFPWNIWFRNAGITLQMLLAFSSPFAILFPLLLLTTKNHSATKWIIIIWAIFPLIIEIFLAHIYNSRYIVIAIAPMILLITMGLDALPRWRVFIVSMSTVLSLIFITQPLTALRLSAALPAVRSDLSQYMLGWSSGWGVHEAAEFLQKEIGTTPAIVFVRADSGNPEDAMYVYLHNRENIRVLPITYLSQISNDIPRYFVSRGTQMAGLKEKTVELKRFNKPMDDEFVGVYQLR